MQPDKIKIEQISPNSLCLNYRSSNFKLKGFQFNELLKQTIITIHNSDEDELQHSIKKQMKKIDDFDVQEIDYMEIISNWILPKLYYFQQKLKQIKGVNMSKIGKHKQALLQKIKNGMRNYDKIKILYQSMLQIHTVDSQTEEKSVGNTNQKKQVKLPQKRQKKKQKIVETKSKKKKKQSSSSSSSSSSSQSSSQIAEPLRRQKKGRRPGQKQRDLSRSRRD